MAKHRRPPRQKKTKSSKKPPSQPFRFLALPRELRDKVYRSILVSEFALQPKPKEIQAKLHFKAFEPILEIKRRQIIDVKILVANEQIYTEARNILVKENTFVFHLANVFGQAIRESTLKQTTRIKASFGHQYFRDYEVTMFVKFLKAQKKLTSVQLKVSCFSRELAEYCVLLKPLNRVKVRDQVVFEFEVCANGPRIEYLPLEMLERDHKDTIAFLQDLKKKMLN